MHGLEDIYMEFQKEPNFEISNERSYLYTERHNFCTGLKF